MSSPANVLLCFRILLLVGIAALALQNISAQQPELKVQTGHIEGYVSALALSPDNRLLASGSGDGVVLWDAVNGKQIRSFRRSQVKSLAFSPNGQFLASGSDSGVNVWKAETGESVFSIEERKAETRESFLKLGKGIPSVRFADNEHLISCEGRNQLDFSRSASLCQTVTIWLVPSGQKERSFENLSVLSTFGTTSDGLILAAETRDRKNVVIRDLVSGKQLASIAEAGEISQARFSPDGNSLVVGTTKGSVRLLNIRTGKVGSQLGEQKRPITALAFSSDGKFFSAGTGPAGVLMFDISPTKETAIMIWKTASLKKRTIDGTSSSDVKSLALSKDGDLLVTADSLPVLWEVSATAITEKQTFRKETDKIESVSFTRDGKLVVALSIAYGMLNDVAFWSFDSGALERQFDARSFAISSENKLVTTSVGTTIWDLATGNEIVRLKDASGFEGFTSVRHPVFNSDASLLAGSDSDAIRVWNVSNGEIVHTFPAPKDRVLVGVTFSPDRKLLAAHFADTSYGETQELAFTKVWEIATEKELYSLNGEPFAFSPNSEVVVVVVTQPGRGEMQLHDARTGKLIASFDEDAIYDRLEFKADGKILMGWYEGRGQLDLWDVATHKVQTSIDDASVFALNSKWDTIALMGSDGAVHLRKLDKDTDECTIPVKGKSQSLAFSPDDNVLIGTNTVIGLQCGTSGGAKKVPIWWFSMVARPALSLLWMGGSIRIGLMRWQA